jgi:hypothetical protein
LFLQFEGKIFHQVGQNVKTSKGDLKPQMFPNIRNCFILPPNYHLKYQTSFKAQDWVKNSPGEAPNDENCEGCNLTKFEIQHKSCHKQHQDLRFSEKLATTIFQQQPENGAQRLRLSYRSL